MHSDAQHDLVYLTQQVKIEPLVARWHAWPHLNSPLQLALHIKYRLLPLLQSFVANPATHLAASSDETMYGGPFVNLADSDVAGARDLLNRTVEEHAQLIALAEALRALEETLQENATGYSLDEYYGKLPSPLRGLVELVYDIYHHPGLRIFEDLLYDQGLAQSAQQIWLHSTPETERSFFMSTPRLPAPGTVSLPMAFADRRIDALAAMRRRPASFAAIAATLQVPDTELDAFHKLFTTQPPPAAREPDYLGDGVRMRYFGHACVLFQTVDVSILFDPFYSTEFAPDGRLTIDDLPEKIDYVVLTHCHQDHFSIEMLLPLRERIGRIIVPANNAGSIADPSMKLALQSMGFERVESLQPFEQVAVPGGRILSLPFTGEHADLNIHSKQAIALTLKGHTAMLLIDSDGRDPVLYERIMARVGHVDTLMLGMECHGAPLNWLYEPLLGRPISRRNNESRRLSGADCARAWTVQETIRPQRVFVYAMGQEPWMKYVMGLQYEPDSVQLLESGAFIERCQQAGVTAERLYGSRELIL